MDKYLQTAVKAAKKAGKVFKASFGKPKEVMDKGAGTNITMLVTEIDTKIENLIKKEISRIFPDHKMLGEESGMSGNLNQDLVWIIDPIDGTTNFIFGIPFCCISIALWDKQGPLLGVIFDPLHNTLFTAQRGKGAFKNGKKIKVSEVSTAAKAIGCVGWFDPKDGLKLYPKLLKVSRKIRVYASSVLTAGFIAQGSLDFYAVDHIKIWDFAAGAIIVPEAGGKISDLQGKPFSLNSKSILISNGKIHNELLKTAGK